MAGHSKFKSIKQKKGAEDLKKSKTYSLYSRKIAIAAKINSNPSLNSDLRAIIIKAKENGIPKDIIEGALKKGEKNELAEEIIYEGFGPENIAVIIRCWSANRNKSGSEIRAVFTKFNGNMNSSKFLFKNSHCFNISHLDQNKVLEEIGHLLEDITDDLAICSIENINKILQIMPDLEYEQQYLSLIHI